MLILTGSTLKFVLGDNSILRKAQEAKSRTEEAIKQEQQGMQDLENKINIVTNEKPIFTKVGLISSTFSTLKLSAIATDENNEKLIYTLYLGKTEGDLVKQGEDREEIQGKEVIWEIEELDEYTKYYYQIEVTDGLTPVKTTIREVVTNRINTAPVLGTVKIERDIDEEKGNLVRLTTKATDTENDKLTYILKMWKKVDEAIEEVELIKQKPTASTTKTGITEGTEITLEITKLEEYTDYIYTLEVEDEWDKVGGTIRQVKTYCSGKHEYCHDASFCADCRSTGFCQQKCSYVSCYATVTQSNQCAREGTGNPYTSTNRSSICHSSPLWRCECGVEFRESGMICKNCVQRGFAHPCQSCNGEPGIPCSHGLLAYHDYCSHSADDEDHKWHYSRN